MEWYNPNKLLNMLDLEKKQPEIFLCSGNRSTGKTTSFIKKLLDDFCKKKKMFGIFVRFVYELDDCSDQIFHLVGQHFYPGHEITHKTAARGHFAKLYFDGEPCGFVLPLNVADTLKKLSQFFSQIDQIFFDEFQSETNHYCINELQKFQSLHATIARGFGKVYRRVPVYMTSNTISLLNPYFTTFQISHRLKPETKFIRGNGWVFEQNYNPNAAKLSQESAFASAFQNALYSGQGYYGYTSLYMDDDRSFIDRPVGKMIYICNIRSAGHIFSIQRNNDYFYVSDKFDPSFPQCYALSSRDMNPKFSGLKSNSSLLYFLRDMFNRGLFRFKNISCKKAIFDILGDR